MDSQIEIEIEKEARHTFDFPLVCLTSMQ